jgi:hypothetical protein
MAGKSTEFRVAMRPGKRRALPATPDGRLEEVIRTAKTRIRSKGENPLRVIKQKFGFQKTRLRGMAKNRWCAIVGPDININAQHFARKFAKVKAFHDIKEAEHDA